MQLKTISYALLIAGAAAFAAVATTSPSLAAKKKAKAAAEEPTAFCFQVQKPVCASRGGTMMTYASACFAQKDGAKVVREGACKPAKMAKASKKKAGKKK